MRQHKCSIYVAMHVSPPFLVFVPSVAMFNMAPRSARCAAQHTNARTSGATSHSWLVAPRVVARHSCKSAQLSLGIARYRFKESPLNILQDRRGVAEPNTFISALFLWNWPISGGWPGRRPRRHLDRTDQQSAVVAVGSNPRRHLSFRMVEKPLVVLSCPMHCPASHCALRLLWLWLRL